MGLEPNDVNPGDSVHVSSAKALAHSSKVMTIATCSVKGPWSAPVYYIFQNHCFYFFSSETARHIMDMCSYSRESDTPVSRTSRVKGDIAVSIFEDAPCFQRLKGLQMSGKVEKACMTKEAAAAASDYIKKYNLPFAGKEGLVLIKKKFNARFYRFFPEHVYYMDNTMGFGCRKKINL
ncbi:MAG: pyridoxamine 5'-phosphate oxidase family protein [Thermodesulfobacteriota bacterium]|nr:pyridoxamine 5'-phosphate oxidase family protein [Thermodesulfobacteriota bacterium]